jgi:lysosomal acid lipase/cholesteryl ester hydrolase
MSGPTSRAIPLYTTEGVPGADVTVHPFSTEDGLGLSLLRFQRDDPDDVVMIIHGLTTSSDMFIMPEHYNLVSYLLDHGFGDVWTLDYRMSNRHPYNRASHRFTMDDVAAYDYPAAIEAIRAQVGPDRRIHVIAHCLGSVTFLMSLFGGAVTNIASTIVNSVGPTPRVPAWSKVKLQFSPGLVEYVLGLPFMDPAWGEDPPLTRGRLFSRVVSTFHRECDVPACHLLSTMWGTGWPALYEHENMHDVTHRRGGDLYGATGVHYYRHVRKMVAAGRIVKYDRADPRHLDKPDSYLSRAAAVPTPILLTTGESNRVFADSNIVGHRTLDALAPGRHELEVYPGYGHQDVFMGKDVALDIFPTMLDFLKRNAEA